MKMLSDHYREKFGCKVYKLSLDGGFTCPNRDGTCGTKGCIFCAGDGSGAFAEKDCGDIRQQLEQIQQKNVVDEVEEIPMFAANTSTIDMFAVGRDYYEKGDYAKAVDWYQQAASIGNAEAMYELANCFMNGIGVEKNLSAAEHMYVNCVEKCSDRWIRGLAEFRIGQIYEKELKEIRYAFGKHSGSSEKQGCCLPLF